MQGKRFSLRKFITNKLQIDNLPIRYKIIALLLGISILPSIVLGLLINVTVDRIMEKQDAEHTLQLIGQANKSLESYVENMQNISYLISFDQDVKRFLKNSENEFQPDPDYSYQIRQFLQGFTTVNPEIAGILLINSDGEYISNEMYARNIKSLTEEKWYKEAIENKGIFKIIGHPKDRNVTSHVNYTDEELVSGVRAIVDPTTQKVLGVVLIDLKLRVISETLKDVKLGKSGYLMVTEENGDTIYAPPEAIISKIPTEWFEESPRNTFSKNVDGTDLQFIYRKSSFTNSTTIGVFSPSESVLEVQQIHFFVISYLFIVIMFGIGASYYLSYSMSRPIRQLNAFMNKAESGDLLIRYKGDREDEIGMLGRSFNTMLAQINKLISLTEIQERQKREAELRALQAHIKPHFLYNTLDTINWMARKKGALEVADVVESLSQLFRIGLSKGSDMITLENEIEHIFSYLKIQKARYKDKLMFDLNIDTNLNSVTVLKLVLQPVVENAIYHGIKERRGPGHIEIIGKEENGDLVLYVKDDGVGIPEEKLIKLNENLATDFNNIEESRNMNKIGYGIMNVQARIKLTFGEPYGLYITSEQGKGTTVKILLPK
ncbi:cache domain-containing sensor histidine kinase [Litchfieldia salsa]|uniref:histidine kinase n=1 Tax=Litchfieldia salsa TaxID=930152 RepID=A0A1H0W2T7_9BACI|nr:sensor histidine kinase [Litchfieldia salsa]SDP85029.1 two-component system, sensor histidine kinase YesM [Litchfieldia salsa]